MEHLKKLAAPLLALAAVVVLSVFATQGYAAANEGISTSPPAEASLLPAETASPEPTLSSEPTLQAEGTPAPEPTATAEPTPEPALEPTPAPPPVDIRNAELPGADAAVLERLLAGWGFKYFKADGKWADDDTYELTLFQRWAGVTPSGKFDADTREQLLNAWALYGLAEIPREKLPLEGRFIGINAGHQRKANYSKEPLSPERGSPTRCKVQAGTAGVSSRVPEYVVNLSVALKLQKKLEALGTRVYLSRTKHDVNISNAARARAANAAGVHAYLSLHCDGNRNRKIYGLHTLVPGKRGYQTGALLTQSQAFARCIQEESVIATGAKDKGYSVRRDLSSLNWSKVPACLVEMGYMSNAAEDKKLTSAAYQNKLADGLAKAFVRYFKDKD